MTRPKEEIISVLKKNNYNRIKTAKAFGVTKSTLWRWMKHYNLFDLKLIRFREQALAQGKEKRYVEPVQKGKWMRTQHGNVFLPSNRRKNDRNYS